MTDGSLSDLDDELRFHLEQQIDAGVARGLDPDEAQYAAIRAFGGVEQRKEECRDPRHVRIVDDDLPYPDADRLAWARVVSGSRGS